MIKRISELTETDKKKYFEKTKEEMSKYGKPWEFYEEKMQEFLDAAFDDELFPKMSPNDQIDAAYIRKDFGKNKPSIIEYLLWQGKFVTHSDYVEVPD